MDPRYDAMDPRYDASLDFLERWYGDAPRVLTAIHPDKAGGIVTSTLAPDEVLPWLESYGRAHNIYFTVNPLLRPVEKKASRTDVAALAWLHIDIDPRAGEDLLEEQDRALRLLREPPGNVPPPTATVFSGGGYQGFWKLEDPVEIGGDLAKADDAARYNIQLEVVFAADHCHNVDRIMRLPGTINRPTAKKRKKGRVEALAELVEWHDDRVYPISSFLQAPRIRAADGIDAPTAAPVIPGNVQRLSSVDDLPEKVPQEIRDTIVRGESPKDPSRFAGDRSQWLWWVCCELVRAGVSDEMIYAVITDPEFGISASVLDKRSSSDRYALRQIRRARDHAIDPELAKMNERHAVIGNFGGRCVVIEEILERFGDSVRPRLTKQSFNDIINRYMNRRVFIPNGDGKPQPMQLGKWWLQHPNRLQFNRVVFSPGKEIPGAYNLWKGFGCEARPGDCSLWLRHIEEIICDGDQDVYRYILGWMARAVQRPDEQGQVAISLNGDQGAGKGKFATVFGSLFGAHFLHVSQPQHVVGNFNSHLRDCVVLFADEAFFVGDPRHVSTLKALITEDTLAIEAKRIDVEQSPNFLHIIMASNEDWSTPAGKWERRYLPLKVSSKHRQDREYFRAIDKQMLREGGREALLHYLLSYDISDYDPRAVPHTNEMQVQKQLQMTPIEEWWFLKLMAGEILDGKGWPDWVFATELVYDYCARTKAFGAGRRGSETRLGMFISKCFPRGWKYKDRVQGTYKVRGIDGFENDIERPRVYLLPPLDVCRSAWQTEYGGSYDWDAGSAHSRRKQEEIAEPSEAPPPF